MTKTTQQPKRFATILVDAPWEGHFKKDTHYPTMTMEQIAKLPIADLAEENAHLWWWCTASTLEKSFKLIRGFGFTPRSQFVWIKFNRLPMGNYLRNTNEFLLFATRGNAPVKFKGQPSFGVFPVGEHSVKPNEVYSIIERVSPGDYLELFARRPVPSDKEWKVWGWDIRSDIIMPNYPVPAYIENPIDFTQKEGSDEN
ncbi:Adenine-specific DNA methyltransferase [Streptococcus gordonii]|uniref:Adenine-specific DNA methyltransferase n=1 Tax=Streptococcus gordonii TaxID=1302 RepID=A0A139MZ29_STRGN|nr:Adenine-specific DNA methyltransferase [Streptococcus gordonii]